MGQNPRIHGRASSTGPTGLRLAATTGATITACLLLTACQDSDTTAPAHHPAGSPPTSTPTTYEASVQIEGDGDCHGTVTFRVTDAWTPDKGGDLANQPARTILAGWCRPKAVFTDRLGYKGPWTLESLIEFTGNAETGNARAVTFDGRPAMLRSYNIDDNLGTINLGTMHVYTYDTLVGDTYVTVAATSYGQGKFETVKDEVAQIMATATLDVSGESN